MSTSSRLRSMFSPVGRAVSGAAEGLMLAREAQAISRTPESVFEAKGTTRRAALNDLFGIQN
ncbi:MAG: hypothetical protein AAF870_02900 [Pseudomonadota bacterium]